MKVFYHDKHPLHAPKWYVADGTVRPAPDLPARAHAIQEALKSTHHELVTVSQISNQKSKIESLTDAAIRAVHSPDFLQYLQTIHGIWHAEFGCDVLPDTFPRRMPGTPPPNKPSAQAGYYCFDLAAPITAGTWEVVIESARCAVSAAQEIVSGHAAAYALCRPPGHHAGADYCGGFCYLNNAAIAAQHLISTGMSRVAILDVDYHQGNGTQDIFYRRRDVLFVSIHADPDTQYPYFWGHAGEIGEEEGQGFTVNLPLARGCSASDWFVALDAAIQRVRAFQPQAIVVSLGVDTFDGDGVGDFHLSLPDFEKLGRTLAALAPLPSIFIQEGGYNLTAIGPCVGAVLKAFR